MNEVAKWFYKLHHMTFSKNVFWVVNCTRDHTYDIIYRSYLAKDILNVSFRLTPCRKSCKNFYKPETA